MKLKLFENWLMEETEEVLTWDTTDSATTLPGTETLHYEKPKVDIKKNSKSNKQNRIDIIKSNGTVLTYRIVGTSMEVKKGDWMPSVTHPDLNFKYIKKLSTKDMVFGRYVEDGVKDETIPWAKVEPLLNQLITGVAEYSPVTGITFYKV